MNLTDHIHQYYIIALAGYLLVITIAVVLVLVIKPFPSFKDSALYDIFASSSTVLSVTYSSVFVVSLVLLIENVFDLRGIIMKITVPGPKITSSSRNVNLSKAVVEEEKAMIEPSPRFDTVRISSSPSLSSKIKSKSTSNMTSSSDDCKSYDLYRQGEAKIILANHLMIVAFLVPSSLILFSTRYVRSYSYPNLFCSIQFYSYDYSYDYDYHY